MAQADADARAVTARAFHAAQVADGADVALLEHLNATASALERAAIALRPGEMAIAAATAAAAVQAAGGAHGAGVTMAGLVIGKFRGGSGGLAGTAVREWAGYLNRAALSTGMSERQLAAYAINSLEGDALVFVNQEIRFRNPAVRDWTPLRDLLIREYDKPMTEAEKVEHMDSLKIRDGEDSGALWVRCKRAVIQCAHSMVKPNAVPEAIWNDVKNEIMMTEVLKAFLGGLRQHWKDALVSRGIAGEEAVRREVLHLEQADKQAARHRRRVAPVASLVAERPEVEIAAVQRGGLGGGRGRGRGRGKGGGQPHAVTSPNNPSTGATPKRGSFSGRGGGSSNWGSFNANDHGCLICGKMDHWQRECPELANGAQMVRISDYKRRIGNVAEVASQDNASVENVAVESVTTCRVDQRGRQPGRQQRVHRPATTQQAVYYQQVSQHEGGGAFYDYTPHSTDF
jgi:hypothetical protein